MLAEAAGLGRGVSRDSLAGREPAAEPSRVEAHKELPSLEEQLSRVSGRRQSRPGLSFAADRRRDRLLLIAILTLLVVVLIPLGLGQLFQRRLPGIQAPRKPEKTNQDSPTRLSVSSDRAPASPQAAASSRSGADPDRAPHNRPELHAPGQGHSHQAHGAAQRAGGRSRPEAGLLPASPAPRDRPHKAQVVTTSAKDTRRIEAPAVVPAAALPPELQAQQPAGASSVSTHTLYPSIPTDSQSTIQPIPPTASGEGSRTGRIDLPSGSSPATNLPAERNPDQIAPGDHITSGDSDTDTGCEETLVEFEPCLEVESEEPG